MKQTTKEDKLWTKDYCFCCLVNFFLFFSYYLLLPTLPFYLKEEFTDNNSLIGLVLSTFTIAALCIRPFSGFLVDMLPRKSLYLFAQFIFVGAFIGYPLATTLFTFILCRMLHGFAFGNSSVSSNTLVIDIMPPSKRGQGLGFFGLSNNLAMVFGPMIGLLLHKYTSFNYIFMSALFCSLLSIFFTSFIKAPKRAPIKKHEPLSFDRFILFKGIPAGISLMLMAIPYGMTTSYLALYAKEFGAIENASFFFIIMAIGLMVSRLVSGKFIDKGLLLNVISIGLFIGIQSYLLLGSIKLLMSLSNLLAIITFYFIAFIQGFSYGLIFPAFNTLFVKLAPNNRRGTAISTFMTSWDIGIGLGLILGGYIKEITHSYSLAFIAGATACSISLIYFYLHVSKHFNQNVIK